MTAGKPTARGETRTAASKQTEKLWRPDVVVAQTDELTGEVEVPVDVERKPQ